MDNFHIVEFPKGTVQNRNEAAVNLHSHHLTGTHSQLLRKSPQTRTDFQHRIPLSNARSVRNAGNSVAVAKKILSKLLVGRQAIFIQQLPDNRWRS